MTSVFTTGGIRGNKKAVTRFSREVFNMGVNKEIFVKIGGFSEMRIGEDPRFINDDLGKRLSNCFFDNIWCLSQTQNRFRENFQNKCINSVVPDQFLTKDIPINANQTFWFPSLFLLGYVAGILEYCTETKVLF